MLTSGAHFTEHEISGDVLLEMDVAMLKEIDLAAFGRRVHIYNAIKELRTRTSRPPSLASRAGSTHVLSPHLAGQFEPDDMPQTPGLASPASMNFSMSPGMSAVSSSGFDHYQPPRSEGDTVSLPASVRASPNGLSFDDQSLISRSSSNVSLSFADGEFQD